MLSYVVAERTVEIGVRMALGAEARQVRRMVVVQGARVVAIGGVIGVAVAVVSTRALGGLLYGVAANDVGTFVGMSVSMILIGILASYVPARRASRVDPIESLRGSEETRGPAQRSRRAAGRRISTQLAGLITIP